jgi:hypothetical protein
MEAIINLPRTDLEHLRGRGSAKGVLGKAREQFGEIAVDAEDQGFAGMQIDACCNLAWDRPLRLQQLNLLLQKVAEIDPFGRGAFLSDLPEQTLQQPADLGDSFPDLADGPGHITCTSHPAVRTNLPLQCLALHVQGEHRCLQTLRDLVEEISSTWRS